MPRTSYLDPAVESEFLKMIELRKKIHPEQFPEPVAFTDQEVKEYIAKQKKLDKMAKKRDLETSRLSRRRVTVVDNKPGVKTKKMTYEEYEEKYKDPKWMEKERRRKAALAGGKKKKKAISKRKVPVKKKPTTKKKPTQRKKRSVLDDGFFMKSGRKFVLTKKYSNKSEAEKELNKLRKAGYYVELSSYSPKKHKQPHMIFKGPLKK